MKKKSIGAASELEIELSQSPLASPEQIRKQLRSSLTPEQRRKYDEYIRDHSEILESWINASK